MAYLCQNRIGTSSSSGKEGDAHVNCSGENWKQTGTSKGTKKYEKSSDDRKEASRKHSGAFGRVREDSGATVRIRPARLPGLVVAFPQPG